MGSSLKGRHSSSRSRRRSLKQSLQRNVRMSEMICEKQETEREIELEDIPKPRISIFMSQTLLEDDLHHWLPNLRYEIVDGLLDDALRKKELRNKQCISGKRLRSVSGGNVLCRPSLSPRGQSLRDGMDLFSESSPRSSFRPAPCFGRSVLFMFFSSREANPNCEVTTTIGDSVNHVEIATPSILAPTV